MNRKIVFGVLLVAALVGGVIVGTKPCIAGWCPTFKCYGASQCGQCRCISTDYSGGTCVDIQHAERMLAEGARELP